MKRKYKRLNLRNLADFKKAEALQRKGWKPILSGIDTILIEK